MSSNPSATGKSFFTIDPRRCALIVIDMQNAFVAEGAVFETPGARAMIPRLEHLIQFARATRIPIVWTQSDHRPPYGGLMLRKFPPIAEDHILWQGEPSFELYPRMLQPREGRLQGSIPQRPERDLRRRHAPGNFKECRPVVWARRLERRIAGGDGSSLRDKLQVMTSAPVGLLGLFGRVDA